LTRNSRSLVRPIRAVILALSIHAFFAALFGISLQFEPKIVQVNLVEPVHAVVIDQAAIEREKIHKADLQREREEEVRRQTEKKKAERLEVKRQADLKKRKEVEIKRKQEEKKKKEAEAKRKAEAKHQEEIKRKQEEKKKKEAEAKRKAEAKHQEEMKRKAEQKKKKEAEAKRQAEEKKKREAEAERQAEEKKKREAEAKRQAEEKKKREAEAKRQAEEKKKREAEEAKRQLISSCSSALGALVGEIESKVHNNWAYAGDATGLEVIISVKVARDGEVASANEWRSSGDPIFDRSAVNALRKASPLPFPDDPRCYEHIKEFNFIFTPDG
jgi:colicin import membrane protein